MRILLARLAAIALLAGGFALTGDIARLVARGRRVIEGQPARAAAAEPAAAEAAGLPPPTTAAAPREVSAPEPPAAPAAEPPVSRPRTPADDAPVGRRVAVPPPPAAGPALVDPRSLGVGDRVFVWLRPAGRGGRGAGDLIALDVIDPPAGEALLHRHAALALADRSAVQAAPRRVVIGGAGERGIARGGQLRITPLHGVNGPGATEDLGTVAAVDVVAGKP